MTEKTTTPEGVLRFDLSIRVDADEMKHWPPQCIKAFFDGIARAQEARTYGEHTMRTMRVLASLPMETQDIDLGSAL